MELAILIIQIIIVFTLLFLVFYFFKLNWFRELNLSISDLLDDYQYQDKNGENKKILPYLSWKKSKHKLLLKIQPEYVSGFPFIGTKKPIIAFISLKRVSASNNFIVQLSNPEQINLKKYEVGYEMSLEILPKKGECFIEIIHKNEATILNKIEKIDLEITGKIKKNYWGLIPISKKCNIKYSFCIGPELGDYWFALDLGTSGSIVASSNDTEKIIFQEEGGEKQITPSIICFDLETENPSIEDYISGGEAKSKFLKTNYHQAFLSFKKHLGYTDNLEVQFFNEKTLTLKGKELTTLLAKFLIREHINHLKKNQSKYKNETVFNDGDFKRAIITVPNNAGDIVIKDLVESVKKAGNFIDIRTITEAEAIICHYIANVPSIDSSKNQNKNVLVFDMGGATINCALAKINTSFNKEGASLFEIDIKSRIGYGIGGDTIDYCLAKFLFSPENIEKSDALEQTNPFSNKYSTEKEKRLLLKKRAKVQAMLLEVKKSIVNNYNEGSNRLLYELELKNIFKESLGIDLEVNDDSILAPFTPASNPSSLLNNPLIKKILFQPIENAILDTIDKIQIKDELIIIFGGRSTLFPYIKELVLQTVRNKYGKDKVQYDPLLNKNDVDLKTIVAEGACWYALNKGAISLSHKNTFSNYGFIETVGIRNKQFNQFIESGQQFIQGEETDRFIEVQKKHHSSFRLDNSNINFVQIMGNNTPKAVSNNEKYRISNIGQVKLDSASKLVNIRVWKNDWIECSVITETGDHTTTKHLVREVNVSQDHEEHYTWLLQI